MSQIFEFKVDFESALSKELLFFSFVDLLSLAAEIDKHGLKNVFLPFSYLSHGTLNSPVFPFLLPFSLPGHFSNVHPGYLTCWYLIRSVTPLI